MKEVRSVWMTIEEIGELFKVKTETVKAWRKRHASRPQCPAPVKGKWNAYEIAKWILKHLGTKSPSKITARKELPMLERFAELENALEEKNEAEKEEKAPPAPQYGSMQEATAGITMGIEAALGRLHNFEAMFAKRMEAALLAGDDDKFMELLKPWQLQLEQMRKTEGDCLHVLEEMKILMRVEIFQEWIRENVGKTKMLLARMPAKIAPQLEDLPWQKIQLMLEEEIGTALEAISRIPFGK